MVAEKSCRHRWVPRSLFSHMSIITDALLGKKGGN